MKIKIMSDLAPLNTNQRCKYTLRPERVRTYLLTNYLLVSHSSLSPHKNWHLYTIYACLLSLGRYTSHISRTVQRNIAILPGIADWPKYINKQIRKWNLFSIKISRVFLKPLFDMSMWCKIDLNGTYINKIQINHAYCSDPSGERKKKKLGPLKFQI